MRNGKGRAGEIKVLSKSREIIRGICKQKEQPLHKQPGNIYMLLWQDWETEFERNGYMPTKPLPPCKASKCLKSQHVFLRRLANPGTDNIRASLMRSSTKNSLATYTVHMWNIKYILLYWNHLLYNAVSHWKHFQILFNIKSANCALSTVN